MATVVIITQECVEIVHHEGGPNSTYVCWKGSHGKGICGGNQAHHQADEHQQSHCRCYGEGIGGQGAAEVEGFLG